MCTSGLPSHQMLRPIRYVRDRYAHLERTRRVGVVAVENLHGVCVGGLEAHHLQRRVDLAVVELAGAVAVEGEERLKDVLWDVVTRLTLRVFDTRCQREDRGSKQRLRSPSLSSVCGSMRAPQARTSWLRRWAMARRRLGLPRSISFSTAAS